MLKKILVSAILATLVTGCQSTGPSSQTQKIIVKNKASSASIAKNAYNFSDDDKPSVAYRGGMYLHNYPGILRKFGYRVVESKLIKTDHPHEDFRLLYMLAERI